MPDEDTTSSTDETTTETTSETSQQEGQEPPESTEESGSTDTDETEETEEESDDSTKELSREDALKELSKVRRESAGYRTRLREAENKLSEAKTPEEVKAVIDQMKADTAEEIRTLMVENVAHAHELPKELREALAAYKFETREEYEAQAKVLAKFVSGTKDDRDPSGGLDPNNDDPDESFDPAAEARRFRRRY